MNLAGELARYAGLSHSVLTPAEERALVERLPDRRARDCLVAANLRLVLSIAKRIRSRGSLSLDDCLQWGALGLVRALETFEPSRGLRLSTYASWWIRQSIRRAIADTGATIRIPVHLQDTRGLAVRCAARVEAATGRPATVTELAKMTRRGPAPIRAMSAAPATPLSLSAPTFDEGPGTLADLVPGPEPTPEAALLARERAREAVRLLRLLPGAEAEVLRRRSHGETLADIGADLQTGWQRGCSRERVRQLETAGLKRLRGQVRDVGL